MLDIRKTLPAVLVTVVAAAVLGCHGNAKQGNAPSEDKQAKSSLQGIWLNDETDDVVFRVKGDTIFFPDSTSVPVCFRIEADSLVFVGENVLKYKIVKQTPHTFEFINQNGESIKLVKTSDSSYARMFTKKQPVSVNQGKLLKSDTVVFFNGEKYHSYVQVNPTSYKVVNTTVNDDGVEVGNIYYDNIVHLAVFKGAAKVFSCNFHKRDFAHEVPQQFIQQAVFSDLTFIAVDKEGLHYFAVLAIPNSSTSYMVEVVINFNGKVTKRLRE
jgi:signal peptidase I